MIFKTSQKNICDCGRKKTDFKINYCILFYKISQLINGQIERLFDESMYQKLLILDHICYSYYRLTQPILHSLLRVVEGFFDYNSPKPERIWMKPDI